MATGVAAPAVNAAEYFKAKLAFETTPHGLKSALEKGTVYLVDVRSSEAYAKEHIAGATNVPIDELAKHLGKLPKDKTLVTYCWNLTCYAAPKAALELAEKGFAVQELVCGIAEWKGAGFPVESGS